MVTPGYIAAGHRARHHSCAVVLGPVATSPEIALQEPGIQLVLRAIVQNADHGGVEDTVQAAQLMLPGNEGACAEILRQQLYQQPGNTWAAYSARRRMTHECEQFLPPNERTVTRNCDLDSVRLGEVVFKQKEVHAIIREQRLRLEALMRAQRRASRLDTRRLLEDDSDDEEVDRNGKKRRIDYRCTRDSCKEVFKSRRERNTHYRVVHNYIPMLNCRCGVDDRVQARMHDQDCPAFKKIFRCPAHGCFLRYRLEAALESHLLAEHEALSAKADLTCLAKCVTQRADVEHLYLRCPIRGCVIKNLNGMQVHEHLKAVHEDAKLDIFRGEPLTLAEVSKAEQERQLVINLRKDPNFFRWSEAGLDLLVPGKLVWARYRDYPFWPGKIDVNVTNADNKQRVLVVFFMGDDTCERIVNFDRNLRPFRWTQFSTFVAAGKEHVLRRFFTEALDKALEMEKRAPQSVTKADGHGTVSLLSGHVVKQNRKRKRASAATATSASSTSHLSSKRGSMWVARNDMSFVALRQLARRGGQLQKVLSGEAWTERKIHQLQEGQLVWYRIKSYPHWPAKIAEIFSAADNRSVRLNLHFFGDNTRLLVKNFNDDLKPFRCPEFEMLVRAGTAHPHSLATGHFRPALAEALTFEKAEAILAGSDPRPSEEPAQPPKVSQPSPSLSTPTSNTQIQITLINSPTSSAAVSAMEEAEAAAQRARELRALGFAAPGAKNKPLDAQMTCREQQRLARHLARMAETHQKEQAKTQALEVAARAAKQRQQQGQHNLEGSKMASAPAAARTSSRFDWSRLSKMPNDTPFLPDPLAATVCSSTVMTLPKAWQPGVKAPRKRPDPRRGGNSVACVTAALKAMSKKSTTIFPAKRVCSEQANVTEAIPEILPKVPVRKGKTGRPRGRPPKQRPEAQQL